MIIHHIKRPKNPGFTQEWSSAPKNSGSSKQFHGNHNQRQRFETCCSKSGNSGVMLFVEGIRDLNQLIARWYPMILYHHNDIKDIDDDTDNDDDQNLQH